MKNVKFNIPKIEKTEKRKDSMKKLDSFNSFKNAKETYKGRKTVITNTFINFKRVSTFGNSFRNKGNFINTRPRYNPKNDKVNNVNNKQKKTEILRPMKSLIQYARYKIKKDYISPFVHRLIRPTKNVYKVIKDEDKPTYYNLFKINDIMNNKKSRFNINFLEVNIYINENEYLIKLFQKEEFRIIIKYLLGYIYFKDINNHSSTDKYNHRRKIVYTEFVDYLNNNYILIEQEKEKVKEETGRKKKQDLNNIFLNDNLLKLSINAEKNKRDFPFLKSPNYFLIKDMPNKIVPNAIPNFFINGKIILSLLKRSLFYKKFYINFDSIKNTNENINLDMDNEAKNNSSYLAYNKELNIGENLSEDLNNNEQKFVNKEINIKNSINNYNNDVSMERLIKNLEDKKEESKEIIQEELKTSRSKKHKTIRKKKKIKQPYEDYEIIQRDNFSIDKTEKSSILKIINDETFNLTSIKIRNMTKHKTRLIKKVHFNIENIKTSSNEKFIRRNRYFLTNKITNTNLNNYFNNINDNITRSRNKKLKSYKRNIYQKEFDTFNINTVNNTNNKNFKIFNNLVRQKKINFSIISKNNIIKFKDTSAFITSINNSIKEKLNSKRLIKEIIINYQKKNNQRLMNSLNFPTISKIHTKTDSIFKRKTYKKDRNNKLINNKNYLLTEKKPTIKNILKIEDFFKHKKIKLKI